MACIDLPVFPLQLLLRQRPEWAEHPVAVVDADKPQGRILWVNERASSFRIRPGMRYAAGLSLAGSLRAAVVPRPEIDRGVVALTERFQRFTPNIEPSNDEPGVFWLDARGLERLHDSLRGWVGSIRSDLQRIGFRSNAVVGFSRFGTYALAKAKRHTVVFASPREEWSAARRVALDRLAIDPPARDALEKLGVTTVGRLIELPVEGLERRFGSRVYRLHRLATGSWAQPLQPVHPHPPAVQRKMFDHSETDVSRLLQVIERLLQPLLQTLAERSHALTEVRVGLRFDRLGDHVESVRPAAPTLDARQLLELIRLRLQAVRRLPDGVSEVVLMAGETEATSRQLRLFSGKPRRDLEAGNRALARVRAELGDRAVVRARLREGHLPEGSFVWENLDALVAARPREVDAGKLVRRIYPKPVPLPPRPRQEPDGWMLHGLQQGPVVRVSGPYIVSGGWWKRTVHREYHFAETRKGELLWVYYDRTRRRWFLHGRVE
jgi:protein ImuB